ncbi:MULTISPECIES: nucleotide exchange factor GrpE [Staphylococcus]|jgi:molecular chaperone GrpE|uniref:Protein GrpE n=4 Tax=Staphylococcus haemolyticus TaxID=1283 RepID=GRPE_STAHJ|nr:MULTISPECIES: nucleotide exchange factor GrpE [Staphylococcus]Q4L6T1.1 RecName: Full=Protein GrpE; AltName: Full=HSP-70 cofactor [Staphylococcus haemolyticus JCSC1435]KDP55305.1 co-chaperone GrpE [Staphylococcus aureus subsp. aureus CO-98]AKC76080.1 heat shock molecular chaperone protein [Staphylococcus haemolyticus]AMW23528.1 molecular chaperone GrpE [Staphylococcus haemolyticus]AUV67358.1 nucleotide exchange factor GrpE [Staphylococcus haemolyticus]AUV69737.1 nucleotide exchange factor G
MTEKDESVKSNSEYTEEQEVKNEDTSTVENVEDTTSDSDNSSNDSSNEESSEETAVDPKDEEIQQLQLKANENEEKYLRLYAEFENYKRRIQKENETNKTYQSQRVLTDILPTIDNIERALQIEGDDESFKSLQKGVQMVHESLLRALKDNGLEEIESEGQAFDPNFHQAVVQDDNPDFKSGDITQELQKGYKLKDRVLRPSMVKVNQ